MPDLAQREPARDSSGPGARPDARSSGRVLAWCLLGGVMASLLPLPWSLASGAFYLAAGVAAVVTLVRLVRGGSRRPLGLALVSGALVLSGLMVLGVLGQVLFYPLFSEAQTCLRTSLTQSGQDECEAEFRRSVLELLTPTR